MLRRLIPENIEVVMVPQPDIWNVLADQNQLEQVILNLSLNARDAMPTGGRLTIETRNVKLGEGYSQRHFGVSPGPYVMLAVSDNGSGMDAQTVSHIFEPFFTTKSSQKGTGLGLAIVYGMVKQNHGDIWVYSELGKGTTMKIYLPRAVGEATGAAQPEKASSQISGNETVLIVEDEDGVRKLITDVLETKGYDVLAAAHGQEAIELAGTARIDLLLTDVVLPNMNGRELANQLLKLQPEMKILFISGYTDNTIFEHGVLGTGANFLAKPFRFEDLLTKVRAVLAAS
jgi:CheY-like chemotaxis protein